MQQSDATHSTIPGAEATRRHTRAAVAALIGAVAIAVLAAALRFGGLGQDSLWYDEAMTLKYARAPISDREHWHNGMVLFHVTLHGWIRLAGESEAALRFPSALFGIAAVALLIALARRINGWTTALLAGLMLALSWKHVYYSQEARAYSLFIMLSVLSTLLLVHLLARPRAGCFVAYGVAMLALAYSHYQFAFVLVFHNAVVLLSRRRIGWGWLAVHVALAVGFVPQLVIGILPKVSEWRPAYIGRYPSVFVAIWTLQVFTGMPPQSPLVSHMPPAGEINIAALYLPAIVAAAGFVACAQPLVLRLWPALRKRLPNVTQYLAPSSPSRTGLKLTWLPLAWLAAVFVLPFIIAQTGKPVITPRYASGTLPVYCWLIGIGLAALPRAWLRLVAAAVCMLLTVPALETMKATPMREDWRGCAETIMAGEQPGDHVVLCDWRIRRPFEHYYRSSLPTTGVDRDLATDEGIAGALGWEEAPQRLWLVVSHDPTPRIVDYFERRPDYRRARHYDREFRGITLRRFDRVEADDTPGP